MRLALTVVSIVFALTPMAGAQDMGLPQPVGMDGQPAARAVLDGNTAFLHGDLKTAARDYRAALKQKPDFAVASFNLGLVETHQGNRTRGFGDMDRGIRLASEHGMASTFVGRLRSLRAAFAKTPIST